MKHDERIEILKGLPKVELHRHLEGSIRPGTMLELGKRYGLDLPLDDIASLMRVIAYTEGEPRTLANFLTKFRADWYRSYKDVERVAEESVADAAREGIVHLELRFSPEHFSRVSGLQLQGVMEAVTEAARAVADETGIGIRFLLTFTRERYDHELWRKIIDLGARMADRGMAGVDLAGDEFHHPNAAYRQIMQWARDTGVLGITIHAGEGTSAEQVVSAVEELGAQRIGHGLKAIEDEAAIRLLADGHIALEMCPISNYQTGCIDDLLEHPLPDLDDAGVTVTLNADDPTIHRTTINDDYDTAVTRWGYQLEDLLRLERNAVRAAFLTEEERQLLLDRIERGYRLSRDQGLL